MKINAIATSILILSVFACSTPRGAPAVTPTAANPAAAEPSSDVVPVPAVFATATAVLRDINGRQVGRVLLRDSYAGVLVEGTVSDLGLGAHGFHIHAIGKCEPPFTSAGGHFNPSNRQHGFLNQHGPHLGDMPNISTPAAGTLKFEFRVPGVTLKGGNALLDADGAAIVVHASRDDYRTDPAGDAGARMACGVITGT
jgi:Cu-Zn family superoxide dismutase